jgi:hypothetical protein
VTTATQPNITSVGTLTSLVSSGNITSSANISGSYILGNGSQLTGIAENYNNSNVTTLLSSFGSNTISTTGDVTAGNFVGALNGSGANVTAISATNISAGTLAQARLANAAVTLGNTALTLGDTVTIVAGLGSVTSTTFVGALTGAATSATTAGTVTTNAQPNITSVGTLTSLAVTGNITGGNLISSGNIATLSSVKRVILVANTAPTGSDGAVGDIWYQTY